MFMNYIPILFSVRGTRPTRLADRPQDTDRCASSKDSSEIS